MNWMRIITGTVIAFATVLLLFTGGIAFSLSVSVIAALALWEFYKLTIHNFAKFKNLIFVLQGLFNSTVLILVTHTYGMTNLILLVSFGVVSSVVVSLIVFKNDGENYPGNVIKQIFGLVYISVPLSFLVGIRNCDHGLFWSLTILCSVAAGDVGAYYIGSLLGRHKLCPYISPNKTFEGSIAGLLCSVIAALVLKIYLLHFISTLSCIAFACFLGIAGQTGDLFASELKRVAGVKDTGKFLPGHGGFLDRIDAILIAMPVAYFFRFYIFV